MLDENPIAQAAYDEYAEVYAEEMKTAPYNVHLEWPATVEFMPDVAGKRVLDAGCGTGRYTEWLVEHGAEVVGVDASEAMVEEAKQRLGDDADVFQANLDNPLDFAETDSFDMVVSLLALHYVENWSQLFSEFYRVLSPSGSVVFTVHHPFDEFEQSEMTEYAETEQLSTVWAASTGKEVEMPFYRRPLSAVFNPLADAGFALKQIREPTPTEEFKEQKPESYEKILKHPPFLFIRAEKENQSR